VIGHAGGLGATERRLATLAAMIANIWHWWVGVLLFAVVALALVGLIGGYVKKVVAPQYPTKRQRRE